jgi:ferritin-like metal-binding protein YciE
MEFSMPLFSTLEFNNMSDLLVNQLQDLYDAEQRLTSALPKMAEAASEPELKRAFMTHLEETRQQVQRLERAFQALGQETKGQTCDAMKGLISEGEDIVGAAGDPAVIDAALIAAAQRVEHYEIAAYGSARTFARQMGEGAVADLLEQTLDEEKHADSLLTDIAESMVNSAAPRG